jgi:hypothetical protein
VNFSIFAFPAVALVTMTSLALLLSRDWRWSILALAVQYAGVFVLVSVSWPVEMAVTKIVAGWMSGAVLGIAMQTAPESWREAEKFSPSGRIFRLFTAALAGIIVFSISPYVVRWIPGITQAQALGGFMLIAMGLLHLGLTAQPLRVVTGLLTVLAGINIFYAAIESSTLVAGLLAAVNLALSLIGAFLIINPSIPEAE